MYVEHFNLTSRPFSRVPSAACCVMFPSMQDCFERACDGIEEGLGPVLVIGPSGSGKTMLLSLLENRFSQELAAVNLNCAAIDSQQGLIQCLLFELGLPFESQSVGELRLKLIDHLKHEESCASGLILMVDEAHNLPIEVLEELRMITNIVCGSQYPIRLVLAGGRPLEEKLAQRQLESFNQRIGVRCYMQNMTRTESLFYVLAQLQKCGRDGREIFQPSALEKIFDITDGVPRLVSQLSDHALRTAAQKQVVEVDSKLVRDAWSDLQQLPQEPEVTSFETPADGIIEFGSLSESGIIEDSGFGGGSPSVSTDFQFDPTAEEPGLGTLNTLMGHLRELDATPDSCDPSRHDASTTKPIQSNGILSAKDLFPSDQTDRAAAETGVRKTEAADSNSNLEQTANDVVTSSELKWMTTKASQENDAEKAAPANRFPLNESTLPSRSKTQEPGMRSLSESLTKGEDAPTDSVFGAAFEEEAVVDLQTSLLAEQNRISSSITIKEVAGISDAEIPIATGDANDEIVKEGDDIEWSARPQEIIEKVEAVLPAEAIIDSDSVESVSGTALAQTQGLPRFSFDGDTQSENEAEQLDDSDMLICETKKNVIASEENPIKGQATSTGQVIRMNYEDLFQQLRNNHSNNQT